MKDLNEYAIHTEIVNEALKIKHKDIEIVPTGSFSRGFIKKIDSLTIEDINNFLKYDPVEVKEISNGYILKLKDGVKLSDDEKKDNLYFSYSLKDMMNCINSIIYNDKGMVDVEKLNYVKNDTAIINTYAEFKSFLADSLKIIGCTYTRDNDYELELTDNNSIKVVPDSLCDGVDEDNYYCSSFKDILNIIAYDVFEDIRTTFPSSFMDYVTEEYTQKCIESLLCNVEINEERVKREFTEAYKQSALLKNLQGKNEELDSRIKDIETSFNKAKELIKALKSENDRLKAELDRLKKSEGNAPVTKDITVEELRAAFRLSLHTLYPNKFTGVRNNNGKSELFLKTAVPDDVLEKFISYIKQNNGGTTNGVIDKQGRLNKSLTERLGGYLRQNKIWK